MHGARSQYSLAVVRLILHIRRTTARGYYVQAPWTERTDDAPDAADSETKKIDLSSCAFPHDGDWSNEVPDPSFLWRCAPAFSPRGLDHTKRRCRGRVAPYFPVTVSIHHMTVHCYLPLKVTFSFYPVISKRCRIRRTNAGAYYAQAPWTERTDDTPDTCCGDKKNDLSSCAFPHDGDWFNEVPDPNFLWRCALAFSPRGLDHAKRRCRDRVAPYFFVTVSIHYMQ